MSKKKIPSYGFGVAILQAVYTGFCTENVNMFGGQEQSKCNFKICNHLEN
jgi:hypothetical protein